MSETMERVSDLGLLGVEVLAGERGWIVHDRTGAAAALVNGAPAGIEPVRVVPGDFVQCGSLSLRITSQLEHPAALTEAGLDIRVVAQRSWEEALGDLDRMDGQLDRFREALEKSDGLAIEALLNEGKQMRENLVR